MRATVIFLVVAACTPAPVYSVRRAAMVPLPAPVGWNGAAMDEPIELGLRGSGIARAPRDTNQRDGIEVPGLQIDGSFRARLHQNASLALSFHEAPESQSLAVADDQPDAGDDGVFGVRLGSYASLPLDPEVGLRIGLAGEMTFWRVPSTEVRTCVDNCENQPMQEVLHDQDLVIELSAALLLSYRSGPWTAFASATLRQHPTIERGGTELYGGGDDSDLQSGDYLPVLAAGVEVEVLGKTRLGALVFQATGDQPVDYPVGASLTLTVPFGPLAKASKATKP